MLRNKPETFNKNDYVAKFYPLIASLILYHPILDKNSQVQLTRLLFSFSQNDYLINIIKDKNKL